MSEAEPLPIQGTPLVLLTYADDGQALMAEDASLRAVSLWADDTSGPIWTSVTNAFGEIEHARAVSRCVGVVNAAEDSVRGRSEAVVRLAFRDGWPSQTCTHPH